MVVSYRSRSRSFSRAVPARRVATARKRNDRRSWRSFRAQERYVVGDTGLEPVTSCMSTIGAPTQCAEAAWSVTLRDGTTLTPPPEAIPLRGRPQLRLRTFVGSSQAGSRGTICSGKAGVACTARSTRGSATPAAHPGLTTINTMIATTITARMMPTRRARAPSAANSAVPAPLASYAAIWRFSVGE